MRRQALGKVRHRAAQCSEPRPSPANSLDQENLTIEDVSIKVHYAPGDRPLCSNESMTAVYTEDPAAVSGCRECLELVAEDPGDDNEYRGHCLHCRQEITAPGGVEWRRTVRKPCPHCGKAGW